MAETSESSSAASSAAEDAPEDAAPVRVAGGEDNSGSRVANFPVELVAAEVSYPPDIAVGTAGYARLAGTGKGAIDYLIRSKTVTIGRAGFGADCQLRSDSKTVSRRHATIEWDMDGQSWAIVCHSKSNALMVDGAPVLADTPPMPLRSRVLIEIGDSAFFFLAAVEPYYRTDNINGLEQQIEQLRSARLREHEAEEMLVARKRSRISSASSRGKRARRNRGSEDEYGEDDDVVPVAEEVVGGGQRRHGKSDARHARNGSVDHGATDDDEPILDYQERRKNKKRKRPGHSDVNSEEDEREARKRRKKEKKKKKKKKKRKREELAAAAAAEAAAAQGVSRRRSDGGGETEDEQDDSENRMDVDDNATDASGDSRQNDEVHDGFDVAPVPSLRDVKPARGVQSKKKTGKSDAGIRIEWNKKERADFCRAIFAVDVDKVYDGDGNLVTYDWTRFRGIASLEKKSDEMLEEFYDRMMADMDSLLEEEEREKRTKGPRTKHKPGCDCVVCENTRKSRRKKAEENREEEGDDGGGSGDQREGGADGGRREDDERDEEARKAANVERLLGLVTAQKLRVRMGIHEAARQVDSPSGQSVIRKLRTQPRVAAANGDLPDWWVNGDHDHALMIGSARHGVGQWLDIWTDRHNREFVAIRKASGGKTEWPTTQVAMKRLREVSSAINAEIRRNEKKKARKAGDDGGASAQGKGSKSQGGGRGSARGGSRASGGGKSSSRRKGKREATPESGDELEENVVVEEEEVGLESGDDSAEEIEIEIEDEGDEEDEEGGKGENEESGESGIDNDGSNSAEEALEVEIETDEEDGANDDRSGTTSGSDDS